MKHIVYVVYATRYVVYYFHLATDMDARDVSNKFFALSPKGQDAFVKELFDLDYDPEDGEIIQFYDVRNTPAIEAPLKPLFTKWRLTT